MHSTIEELRKNIRNIDSEIFRLIKNRLEIASVLGELKSDEGRPLRDLAQEHLVFSHHVALACELGIPKGYERITQALIELCLNAQLKNSIPVHLGYGDYG